jgi:hypothetical protein
MPDFGIFRGFNEKLFGDKLYAGQLPINLGLIGSEEVFNFNFLLDDYPNAAAAYSLRKLRSGYTGSAIRVRRSSDNTEQDIGFDLMGALDTTALLAFTGTGVLDYGLVKTWYDQSGNGRNATQTTAASQPRIVSSGTVLVDSQNKPQLQLTLNGHFNVSNLLSFTQPFSPIVVAEPTSIGSFEFIFDSTGSNRITTFSRNTQIPAISAGMTISAINTHTRAQHLYFSIYNTTNSFLYLDSMQTISGNAGSNSYSDITLGSIFGSVGKASEFIFYGNNQSSNRTGIENNINDFYSIY